VGLKEKLDSVSSSSFMRHALGTRIRRVYVLLSAIRLRFLRLTSFVKGETSSYCTVNCERRERIFCFV